MALDYAKCAQEIFETVGERSRKIAGKIEISKGGKSAEATKLMAVMGLGVKCGDTVEVTVEGKMKILHVQTFKPFLRIIYRKNRKLVPFFCLCYNMKTDTNLLLRLRLSVLRKRK